MVTSGIVSLARTRLPSWTISAPVRPAEGRGDGGVLELDLGVLHRGAIGLDRGVERRRAGPRRVDLFARGDAALGEIRKALGLRRRVRGLRDIALRGWPAPACNAASSGRRSSAKSTWPCLTSSPSLKLTEVSWPVICACTATVEYGFGGADDADLERHRFLHDRRDGDRNRRAARRRGRGRLPPAGASDASPPEQARASGGVATEAPDQGM